MIAAPRMPARPVTRSTWLWLLIALLAACRLPSLVEPPGGDQGLYAYTGMRLLAGGVPYRDMWDQKPPGIGVVYAGLLSVWPHPSVVPAADLAVSAMTAALLVVLGRRRFSAAAGWTAAVLFLLFGDPAQHRLSGVYIRGQCEPFIALAVTAALVLVAAHHRRIRHVAGAGLLLGAAFWLKYNAATYAAPIVLGFWCWRNEEGDRRRARQDLAWTTAAFVALAALVLAYFVSHGALDDLRLATIDYNLRYSHETYDGAASVPAYLASVPVERARADMLWYLGGLGAMLMLLAGGRRRSTAVALAWLAAAVLSIAINGQRDLPNYFAQAGPALALVAGAGLVGAVRHRRPALGLAAAAAVAAGIWRVGAEEPVLGLRWGGLPGVVDNVRFDLDYARGAIDRDTYLDRFRGQKFDAREIDRLVRYIDGVTTPGQPVYVFGFLGGSV
jgi:hypothetical protein